jgi:glycine cleavage system aminomethyltransferase T
VTSSGTEAPPDPSLVLVGDEIVGNTTSAVWSDTLQAIVGLALVPQAMAALGTELTIKGDHGLLAAEVVKTPFYDPEAARQAL